MKHTSKNESKKASPIVAVTCVGGGIGQSLLKGLQQTSYTVIGLDADGLAAGLYAVPKARKIPPVSDPTYAQTLLKICIEEQVSVLFPGLDRELPILALEQEKFSAKGITIAVSQPKVIEIADDKLKTSLFLKKHNFPAPRTMTLHAFVANPEEQFYPMVIKPKTGGESSHDVFVVRSHKQLEKIMNAHDLKTTKFVAQEYIEGDEYTCGTVTLQGKCRGAILMKRQLRYGDTYKCFVEDNPKLESFVCQVAEALQPFGACNFQLRLKNDVPYIFEINARSSGTTGARSLAGFNEPKMIADFLIKGKAPEKPTITACTILRYWKEVVVSNEQITTFTKTGLVENKGSALL